VKAVTAVRQEDGYSVGAGRLRGGVVSARGVGARTAGGLEDSACDWRCGGVAGRRCAAGPRMDVTALEERLRAAERRADNLERGLMSNRRIGMAIGVLVTIRHLTDQQAFDELRGESMRRNVKLRDLAEQVIYTGTL
jgi:hypothetical protein